jgi:DNA helicase II / ATP-dependent DNA helicase PcrA
MKPDFLTDLNSIQKQAVTHSNGNLLVLAGAGSGKTRVLVHRIAWLLSQGVPLHNILAVTFTNKAANEMRKRLEQMLQISCASLWVGTFHGLSHRLLRLHFADAGLSQSFQIIDSDDQLRLIKAIHKELSLDKERWHPQGSQQFINNNKEKGIRATKFIPGNPAENTLGKVYLAYEETCQRSDLVDFAELLLRVCELFQKNQELRDLYQKRFWHVLVDEFQDTNSLQYNWIKLLSGPNSKITAVGDDDQSIYSWRGADSGNMQRFTKEYLNVNTIRLEQNYRSTSTILAAANAVIAHNNNRLGKNLWTKIEGGEPITLYTAYNEIDEANYIVDKIRLWLDSNKTLNDVAILYRSNAQSRIIEEQLLRGNISYKVYGGVRFFERAEIKDVLAYLRLLVNRNDDAAFARVVNLPTRGIGETNLDLLRNRARENNCSLWQIMQNVVANKSMPGRFVNACGTFINLIDEAAKVIVTLDLADLIKHLINITGLRAHYLKAQYADRGESRLENLDELVNAAKQFSSFVVGYDRLTFLQDFLSHITLESGEHVDNNDNDCVKLMTLHSAKGLEFPLVFLCGLEEGLFPHIMSMRTTDEVEEERRLCYVGMTRAMQKLYLLHAESRQLRGTTNFRLPSRFLREVPTELMVSDSLLNKVEPALSREDVFDTSLKNPKFSMGQEVSHEYFGDGIITGFDGDDEFMAIKVRFKKYGDKLLSPQYIRFKGL